MGLGVIDNGRLINGFLGAATEIGHISIDVNGRPCDCGNVGCLERYCSTPPFTIRSSPMAPWFPARPI